MLVPCIHRDNLVECKGKQKVKIEIETNQSSIAIDPYSCAVKAKEKYFDGWKTVGHVPRKISRYIYFFIKKENILWNGFEIK